MTQTDVEIYHVLRFEEYCQNDYTIQSNLQINAINIKFPVAFFRELEPKKFKICTKTQKTLNGQSNLEKENCSWRNQATRLQSVAQSDIH